MAGKSMKLGGGGRAAKLKKEGVPDPVIGEIARSKGVYGHDKFGPKRNLPPSFYKKGK